MTSYDRALPDPDRVRRHLRDADTICTDVFPSPGHPMRCELDAGHHPATPHKHGCTRWGRTTDTGDAHGDADPPSRAARRGNPVRAHLNRGNPVRRRH